MGEVSTAIEFVVGGIPDMGEVEALEKAWLVGRGVYGDGDDGELYSLTPDRNSSPLLERIHLTNQNVVPCISYV